MSVAILATKLHAPPPCARAVPRPRLYERLDDGLRQELGLILLSAPAGSGKTTLLGTWAKARDLRVAWFAVDEDDNDPARFWAGMAASLHAAHPEMGPSPVPLARPSDPGFRDPITSLLARITELPTLAILVLDDYHLLTEVSVHEGVTFLLDHIPRTLHLVIATRVDPPLPIARLRLRGRLTALGAEDLRFLPQEATAFMSGMGLRLRPEEVSVLETRTEGWIAGLRLAALSLRGRGDTQAFIASFTGGHPFILDFLVDEVVKRQPHAVQEFLLRTSVLERLCSSLCDALMGRRDGAQMLERIRRENLFTIPLDDERCWYRYHHLFGDLLRKRLRQIVPHREIVQLHRRAARWLEEHDLLEHAVRHALAAEDWSRVASLAERCAGGGMLDARLTTLLRWVAALPDEVIFEYPRLRVYRAWALFMSGQLSAARRLLADCRAAVRALPDSSADDCLRRETLRLLDTIDAIARGLMCAVDNRTEEAIRICTRARDRAVQDGHLLLAAQATEGLALAYYYQGRLHSSAETCRQMIELAERGAARTPLAAAGYVELAGIYTEWNQLRTAAEHLDKALALCGQTGPTQTLSEACTAQSRLCEANGDLGGAHKAIERAASSSSAHEARSLATFRLAIQRAKLDLRAGNLDQAERWVREMEAAFSGGQGSPRTPAAFIESLRMMRARLHLARNEARKAIEVLEAPLSEVEAAGSFLRVIEFSVLKALALQALGETTGALDALRRSLVLAEPEGYVRMYLDAGQPMAALLREAAGQGISPDYANRLLGLFSTAPSLPERPLPPPDLLTPRELEVLRLISLGLSNTEIAGKLFVAVNTVKRHTSSIYGKLGVRSRTRAAARARELGLLRSDPG